MAELVANLQALVESDRFLSAIDVAMLDDILDARDSDPFDSEWCRVNELVSRNRHPADATLDALRESAFKRAFAITESADACGYISDDFGLLADASRADISDSWLVALAAAYASGSLPHGELNDDSRTLDVVLSGFQP